MRKLLMLVTMLLVPTLASAWTLPVKVTNTTAGINAGYKASVVIGATNTDVTVGTKYFYPANTVATVYVNVASPDKCVSITLDGVAQPLTSPVTIAKGTASFHSLDIVYSSVAAAPKADLNLTQTTGGLTSLSIGSSTTTLGYKNVASGTMVTAKAQPSIGYKVRKIYAGTFKVYSTTVAAASAAPVAGSFVTTAVARTVTATYINTPAISAQLFLPASGTTGAAVNVTAAATGNVNLSAVQYQFSSSQGKQASASPVSSYKFTPAAAGSTNVKVYVSADGVSANKTAAITIVAGLTSANYVCTSCHAGSTPVVVANYNSSAYKTAGVSCQGCHTNAPHNSIVNTVGGVRHSNYFDGKTCDSCHSDAIGKDAHATALPDGCVDCHAVAQNFGPGFVQDNNGVRAIVGEFAKRSHHVTGRAVKNSDCAVCHLEGKKSGTAIVVDRNYHMVDNKTYLRNGNTGLIDNQSEAVGAGYPWNPEAPNFTLMDQFCFSCHNQAGAPAAFAAIDGVAGYTGSALNPFGDTVSNAYDQVSRINVVGVYEQFDTGNSSHHAVRGAKYTSKTLDAATFTNISTNNYNFTLAAASTTTATKIVGIKPLIGTMSSLGKFTATYTTLDNVVLADNITIHCGDCHTVGQFRAADVGVKPFNNAVIGAHGSGNEYMLRNSNGDDTLAKDALVCYICHNYNEYGSAAPVGVGPLQTKQHNGANPSLNHCNNDVYNTAGLTGVARLFAGEGSLTVEEFETEVAAGEYGADGGGNIFGIKCANCHNSSDKKTFGGIHGNAGNATYQSYSGAKRTGAATVTVNRLPYRFMPGLGNIRYNGGDKPSDWTVKTVSSANKQSCYTLNGASTVLGTQPNPSRTFAAASGANVSTLATTSDNGILGSWGACSDHAGSSTSGGLHDPSRTILRPLTY